MTAFGAKPRTGSEAGERIRAKGDAFARERALGYKPPVLVGCAPGQIKAPVRKADRILSQVAGKHRVAASAIIKPGRSRHLVIARQECMYRLLTETRMSSAWIGRFLKRDHSTVLEGGDRHARRFGLDLPRNRDIAR